MTAAGEAEVRRVRTARSLNYELAALIRVGFHDPKKFPGYDKFMGNKERAAVRSDDLHDYLMALSLRPSSNPKTKG